MSEARLTNYNVRLSRLISASVGTVVYYGFQCQHATRDAFLAVCFAIGVSGSIFPFMDWFNMREYKVCTVSECEICSPLIPRQNWRIAFFLTLAFSSIAPLFELARLHSVRETIGFIAPIAPSLASYIVGLVFYATHFPECVLAARSNSVHWLDWLGGGSHAIWHVCIVLAISLHKRGMEVMKSGIGEACAA